MAKSKEHPSTQLAEMIAEAEKAVTKTTDPELRRIAFDRVLQHLLQTGLPERTVAPKIATTQTARAKKAKKDSTKPGPKAWLQELADEGFFKIPKTNAAIRAALDERGHMLKPTDLTFPLSSLVKEKVLRRKKMAPEEGGKSQVHWHNW